MHTECATKTAIDRRALVAGAAGAVALGTLAASSAQADEASIPTGFDAETDVLVIGGGIGGCIAAYEASRQGASVMVAEAGAELGGSFLLSSGYMRSSHLVRIYADAADDPENLELLHQLAPTADAALLSRVLTDWDDFAREYLPSIGSDYYEAVDYQGFMQGTFPNEEGTGTYESRKAFMDDLGASIEGAGGEIRLCTRGVDLVVEDGTVVGAVLFDREGVRTKVRARAVILACGSYVNDPVSKVEYVGPYADNTVPRAVPFNVGDGQRMAAAAGACLTKGMGRFYGFFAPWPSVLPATPEAYDAANKADISKIYRLGATLGASGILVNLAGKRFADEGNQFRVAAGAYHASELLAQQDQAVGFGIVDAQLADVADSVAWLADLGAVVEQADTLEGLVDLLAARGVDRDALLKTLSDYVAGNVAEFDVPDSRIAAGTAKGLVQPPFYALQVTSAISRMFGGVKIDADGHAVGHSGQPVPGLYATFGCAGGMEYDEYLGCIGNSALFGKIAAQTAVQELG